MILLYLGQKWGDGLEFENLIPMSMHRTLFSVLVSELDFFLEIKSILIFFNNLCKLFIVKCAQLQRLRDVLCILLTNILLATWYQRYNLFLILQ